MINPYMIVTHQCELDLFQFDDSDWYAIVKKDSDRKRWWQPIEQGNSLIATERISDACIEGDKEEMRCIAEAIIYKEDYSAKRCAVSKPNEAEYVLLWSPRNSVVQAGVPRDIALGLAIRILDKIGQ